MPQWTEAPVRAHFRALEMKLFLNQNLNQMVKEYSEYM